MATTNRVYLSSEIRRREIVLATISVLSARGYVATSFSRIQEAAGLSSTRMISYHFADKAALMGAVVEHVVAEAAAVMVPAMEAESTWRGKLAAYIRSNLRYLADSRDAARAVIEVIAHVQPEDNTLREDTSIMMLALLLMRGQEAGEFRAFDAQVVARSVRATIDSFATSMPGSPEATATAIDDIVALFDRGTRSQRGHDHA